MCIDPRIVLRYDTCPSVALETSWSFDLGVGSRRFRQMRMGTAITELRRFAVVNLIFLGGDHVKTQLGRLFNLAVGRPPRELMAKPAIELRWSVFGFLMDWVTIPTVQQPGRG
jgi:hypothetical protein